MGHRPRRHTGTAAVFEPRVFRAHAWVIQTGADRVRIGDLAVRVFHDVGTVAVQDTGLTGRQGCRVLSRFNAMTAGLDTDHADTDIFNERIEHPNCIRAATHAGDNRVRQPADFFQALRSRFAPIMDWKSRTNIGYGCGPAAVPRM